VLGVQLLQFLPAGVPPAQIQELSFIKHKVGGAFIGPCILSSGRSVNVIQVKGVFGAVAGEGF
jgi:hypothetical protein